MSGPTARVYFKGFYTHGVDDKRRIQIPAKWRPVSDDAPFALMLWQPTDQKHPCIVVLSPQAQDRMVQKLEEMPFSSPEAESLRRILGSQSDDAFLDKAGRICLPDWMAGGARIEDKSILVGLYDRFQIWRPEYYSAVRESDLIKAPQAHRLI